MRTLLQLNSQRYVKFNSGVFDRVVYDEVTSCKTTKSNELPIRCAIWIIGTCDIPGFSFYHQHEHIEHACACLEECLSLPEGAINAMFDEFVIARPPPSLDSPAKYD